MHTAQTIINALGIFLLLLSLNAIATGLLVGGQLVIAKVNSKYSKKN